MWIRFSLCLRDALRIGLVRGICNDKVLKLFGRRVGLCVEWSDVNGVQVNVNDTLHCTCCPIYVTRGVA